MRIVRTIVLITLFATSAIAQLSMGNGITTPNSGDFAVAATRTNIDLVNPANATGTITAVRFYWSNAACTNAVKIKFFRRAGGNLTLVAERGPFSTTTWDNHVTLASPVSVQQGDLIGITRIANCGNSGAMIGIVTAGSLQFAGDATGTVAFDSGTRRGEVIGIEASGTATEKVVAVLPVVGSTAGGFGSQWRTSLQLANCFTVGSMSMSGRLVLRKQGVPGSSSDVSIPYSISPNSSLVYADVVSSFGFTGLGSIDVVVPAGKMTPAFVTRVYNDAGSSGTSGFSEPLVDPTESYDMGGAVTSMGATSVMITPTDATHTRFNIGVRSLFSGAKITATLKNSDGTIVTSVTKSYWPNSFEQISAEAFFGGVSIGANQMVVISVNDGSAIIYGSTTDNVTNDPSVQFATVAYAIL